MSSKAEDGVIVLAMTCRAFLVSDLSLVFSRILYTCPQALYFGHLTLLTVFFLFVFC